MSTIQLDHCTPLARPVVHYHVEGTGPDVLFIHGWGSSLRMWERPLKRLASAGFRAWALDLPGSGASEAPGALNGWYTIANLAGVVEAFVERAGLVCPALVGHSMGGAIVLEMAGRQPGAPRALVLVAPVVSGRMGLVLRVLLNGLAGQWLLRLVQRHGSRSLAALPWPASHTALRRDVEDLLRTAPGAVMGGPRAVLDFDFTGRLPAIHVPTLVIVGTRDLTLPPAEAELAAARIPGARLVRLRGAGHQPPDERPQEFDRLLVSFLQEHCQA